MFEELPTKTFEHDGAIRKTRLWRRDNDVEYEKSLISIN